MIPKHVLLNYYKRPDIREAIVNNAKDREIAVRFEDKFGKRPDVLNYSGDVLELVKQGATSFHASEEHWQNPLRLDPEMKKREIDNLRTGWDLVLDIDCPYWKLSKIITWLFIKVLRDYGINSVSVKFSGNKGFHIGVSFDAFSGKFNNNDSKDLFPELPRAIANFLLFKISDDKKYTKVLEDNTILFGESLKLPLAELQELTGKKLLELTKRLCSDCNKEIKSEKDDDVEFICSKCGSTIKDKEANYKVCEKCNIIMKKIETKSSLCSCGSNNYYTKFDPLSIIDVDTILISSRHLYRMPYSLHEKSGLASIPFNPEKILEFEKELANPEIVKVSDYVFLYNVIKNIGEGNNLALQALEFVAKQESVVEDKPPQRTYEDIGEVPKHLFPPCIPLLQNIKDGRKRALFILTNFLTSCGWDYDKVEEYLREWNNNLDEPLREVMIVGQLRYHKQRQKKILPPNCDNNMYYVDIGVCKPDNLCKRIKNPVNYARIKGRSLNKGKK